MLLPETHLCVGELRTFKWVDVYFQPAERGKFGSLRVRKSTNKNAKRNLSLAPSVRTLLETRKASTMSPWVSTDETGTKAVPIWTLENQHRRMAQGLKLPTDAVIHPFRHTYGTRLGKAESLSLKRKRTISSLVCPGSSKPGERGKSNAAGSTLKASDGSAESRTRF